jgi:hypothetical protein
VVDPGIEHGHPTGTPGVLNLDGEEYDWGFSFLLLDFFAVGSPALSDPDMNTPIDVETDLTLLPVSLDLKGNGGAPVTTKASFDVWNAWEVHFAGAYRCVTFWDQTLLSLYEDPNNFLIEVLQTDKAKARLAGYYGEVCGPDTQDAPLLGVAQKQLYFDGGAGIEASGRTLAGMGLKDGVLIYDPRTYCEASGGCEEHIGWVQVGDIDNPSGCDGYADYTDLSTGMAIGAEYEITVWVGDPYDDHDQGGIWVDWNRDGDFEDEAETIAVEGSPGYGPYTAMITPPMDAVLGDTRMRIRVRWEGVMDPCDETPYGEVEDYTITVAPAGVTGACCVEGECVATTTCEACTAMGGWWFEGEACSGEPPFQCPCEHALWHNGEPNLGPGIGLTCERDISNGLESWVVDDVMFEESVVVQDLHWWASADEGFGFMNSDDIIILTDAGGMPGDVVVELWDVYGIHHDTCRDAGSRDVYHHSIDGLEIPLPAGTYWFGMRPVDSGGGQSFHLTAVANGTNECYFKSEGFGYPDWTPSHEAFGVSYEIAFCVTGAEQASCPADFDGDGDVDTADLLHLLACWGTDCGDVDGDGDTDTADLLALLGAWGECP